MNQTNAAASTLLSLFCVFALDSARVQASGPPPQLQWVRQLGTSGDDFGAGITVDVLGNVYISGQTAGSLGGPNAGSSDAFLSKYDAAGTLQWTRQLGTASVDSSQGASVDGLGNVYISGYTRGNLGGPNAGFDDAFLSKYNAAGSLQWTKQLGTTSSDISWGVSADGIGNVYISGQTSGSLSGPIAGGSDAFLRKYDAVGNLQWSKQLGTSELDYGQMVSADHWGNVYLTGSTNGNLQGMNTGFFDTFISKFDAVGVLLWTRQLGSVDDDLSLSVSADMLGNVFISGYTYGSVGAANMGDLDAFLTKYDAAGNLQWSRQLGTIGEDYSPGVTADGLGNVYISGGTAGSLGSPNLGNNDAFLSKYDSTGALLWTHQLGTTNDDSGLGVTADGLGNVYITGNTYGSLGGPHTGGSDAFVAKFFDPAAAAQVPEPTAAILLVVSLLGLLKLHTATSPKCA